MDACYCSNPNACGNYICKYMTKPEKRSNKLEKASRILGEIIRNDEFKKLSEKEK